MYSKKKTHWRLQSDRHENLLRGLSECERAIILCGFYVVHTHPSRHHHHAAYTPRCCLAVCVRACAWIHFNLFLPNIVHSAAVFVWLPYHTVRERERKRERHNGRSDKTLYVLNVYMNAAAAVSSVCSSSIHTLHFAYVTLILISFILFVAFISIRVSKL